MTTGNVEAIRRERLLFANCLDMYYESQDHRRRAAGRRSAAPERRSLDVSILQKLVRLVSRAPAQPVETVREIRFQPETRRRIR